MKHSFLFIFHKHTFFLQSNLNIGSALMSRFDLFFVVLDDCDKQIDTLLAQHIVNVHRSEAEFLNPPFSAKELNLYIKYAHTIKPIVCKHFS